MTSDEPGKAYRPGTRVFIIDPRGTSKYASVAHKLDGHFESLGYGYEPEESREYQSPQDSSPMTPEFPLRPGKLYRIVLPQGFDHNDYDLSGTSSPTGSPEVD